MNKFLLLIIISIIADSHVYQGLQLVEITTANQSVAFVSAKDGSDHMYIVERPGVIKSFSKGQQSSFLDISDKVEDTFSDQGLLGLAFDPNYIENGFFLRQLYKTRWSI